MMDVMMNADKDAMIIQAVNGKFMYRYKSITQTIVFLIDPTKIGIEYLMFRKPSFRSMVVPIASY